MRAVILAGGKGTRLRPYTTIIPKPLMPVGDRPILDIIIRQLKQYGFSRVTMAVGYLAELIEAYFSDGNKYGIGIDLSWKVSIPVGEAKSFQRIGSGQYVGPDVIFAPGSRR